MKISDRLVLAVSILVSSIFIYLFYLESFNFNNYVFATLHFNLARFAIIPGIFWAGWAIFHFRPRKIRLVSLILIIVFCLVSIPSGIQSLGNLLARTVLASKGEGYVVQKSMEKMYGNDYKFLNFVKSYFKDNPNAEIIIPPNTLPWRHTGNPQIMDSYLYPVATTNSTESATPFMLISSETESAPYHLWPDFKVPAKEIIIFNWEEREPTIIKDKNWDPSQWQDVKPWGIIIKSNE